MKYAIILSIGLFLIGCNNDNPTSTESTQVSMQSSQLTYANVYKEESESKLSLNEDSPIFEKYLRLAENGDSSAQFRVYKVYADDGASSLKHSPPIIDLSDKKEQIKEEYEKQWADELEKSIERKKFRENEANRWLNKAAKNGNGIAQEFLANSYKEGIKVPRDYNKAIDWYDRSASQNSRSALVALGDIYREGKIVPKNCQKSFEYLVKLNALAADWDKTSKYIYGIAPLKRLFEDKGCSPKNSQEAFKWYAEGARLEIESAQYQMGLIYEYGKGVERDMRMASHYYEQAANKGYVAAQYNFGLCNAKGIGVTRNLKQAYFWMLLVSAKEDRDAMKMRDDLEKMITSEERAQAQEQARTWKPI